MSVLDHVRQSIAPVVAAGGLTDPWAYRRRTSAQGDTPAFGAWIDVPALVVGMGTDPQFDDAGKQLMDREVAGFRCGEIDLTADDQVRGPDGRVWAVLGLLSSAPGVRRYRIGRDLPRLASPINRSQR